MPPRTAAALALTALLLGCADTATGGRAASGSPAAAPPPPPPAAAAAAAAAGPVGTQFDGRYRGMSNLTMTRGNTCGAQRAPRSITVQNGQARMIYDTLRDSSAAGAVQQDGSVTLRSESDRNTTITGRFANGRFQGGLRSSQCVRALDLRRA